MTTHTNFKPTPTMRRVFTVHSGPPLIDVLELQSRCYAAARLAMMGSSYGPDDRMDCASRLLVDVWGSLMEAETALYSLRRRVPTSLQGDGVSYSAKSRQKSKDDAPDVWAEIPAIRVSDAPTFSTLMGRAANLRRSLDRDRNRDAEDAAQRAAVEAFLPYLPDAEPEVRSTSDAAHRLAAEMAEALGLAFAHPVYVATYTAARSASGEASDVIAEELSMSGATYRQSLKRGRDRIAKHYASILELSSALYVPEGGHALKPSASRMKTASIGDRADGWRDSQRSYGIAPVRTRTTSIPSLPCKPAAWTGGLGTTTRTRLTHAARRQAETRLSKPAAQRMADRLAAGVSA